MGPASESESRTGWTLGEVLRKARKARRLEQKDVAEMVDVTRQTVSNWENNKGEPTASQWFTLARKLDAPWLLQPEVMAIRQYGCIQVYAGRDIQNTAA